MTSSLTVQPAYGGNRRVTKRLPVTGKGRCCYEIWAGGDTTTNIQYCCILGNDHTDVNKPNSINGHGTRLKLSRPQKHLQNMEKTSVFFVVFSVVFKKIFIMFQMSKKGLDCIIIYRMVWEASIA